jgi:hypothetical protein
VAVETLSAKEDEIATPPRFPESVFPFVTCEPSVNHGTIAETGRLYE